MSGWGPENLLYHPPGRFLENIYFQLFNLNIEPLSNHKWDLKTAEMASGPLHDLSLGHNAGSPLWFIESESGYQEMHLALEECHDSTLPWQVETHEALTISLTYPNAIESSYEKLGLYCPRQMLMTLSYKWKCLPEN